MTNIFKEHKDHFEQSIQLQERIRENLKKVGIEI
jgi:hypothetical protein